MTNDAARAGELLREHFRRLGHEEFAANDQEFSPDDVPPRESASLMMSDSSTHEDRANYERAAELSRKGWLTDDEMQELIRLAPPGQFGSLPNAFTLGVIDLGQAFANLRELPHRRFTALRSGFYIEVLSLRLQEMDLWLRMFWVSRNPRGHVFDATDRRTFGALIGQCAELGFDTALVERMKAFNAARRDAIHRYLLGAINYDALRDACTADPGLDGDVRAYVVQQIGVPLS